MLELLEPQLLTNSKNEGAKMSRRITTTCPICGSRYSQDWEDPDECPYCDGEEEVDDDDDSGEDE